VRVLEFDSAGLREIPTLDDYHFDAAKPGITWVNVTGIRHPALLQIIGERFALHPLVLEDIANPEQRPKLEDYDDYIYIVVKAFAADGAEGADVRQISLVLGQDFVVSFQEEGETVLAPIDAQVRRDQGRIRAQGADRLLWALLDAVVDGYFGALEQLGEQIEDLEEQVAVSPEPSALEALHRDKRRLLRLRQAIWPMREVSSWLELTQNPLLSQATRLYFRDLHDHIVQAIDMVEISREVLSSILDIYVSSLSNRMNEIMKVLTIFSALFMPLTFIAGIYGMNFDYMPELSQRWGYPAVLAAMATIFATMLLYVRRRRWW
jgi:magnesium transporter